MNSRKDSYRIGHTVDVYDIADGCEYCSKWGLTDLYPHCEKNLRQLIDSQEDFMTEWCGSKKELLAARYRSIGRKFEVEVNAWMDDLWDSYDLICDAIDEILHNDEKYKLSLFAQEKLKRIMNDDSEDETDEFFNYVRDMAFEDDINDEVMHSMSFDAIGVTYEKVMETVEKLEDETMAHLRRMYEVLCNIVAGAAEEV